MIEENKAKQMANKALIQNAMEELPQFIFNCAYLAKVTKIRYDAYIAEGFEPEQALFLCKDSK